MPEEYVQILLADMPNAFMNSGREKRHLRPPVWREKSNVFHYRDHDLNDIVTALGQQSAVPLKLKKTYLGNTEVEERNKPQKKKMLEKHWRQPKREQDVGLPTFLPP